MAQSILPPPPVPVGNPTTPDKVLLGKALFWDEQLSSSRDVACGTCHAFAAGGSDARLARHPGPDRQFGTADDRIGSSGVVRHRADGSPTAALDFGLAPQVTARRSRSPINAAYARALFADGRADDVFTDPLTGAVLLPADAALENQVARPPVDGTEMAHLGRTWADIAAELPALQPLRLATSIPAPLQAFVAGQTYAALFAQAFGSPGVTPARVVMAIAAYERTLIADQSPFDRWLSGQGTLTFQQQAGLATFQARCAGCHTDLGPGVLLTGPVLDDFRNIGLRPPAEDPGRAAVTGLAGDRGRMRVPGLRNVALRAPFFHNGQFATLAEVVDFYARGGDFHDNQDPLVPAIVAHITIQDRVFLPILLQALTDPRVAAELPPFDRPRLWSEGPLLPLPIGTATAGAAMAPRVAALGPPVPGRATFALTVEHARPLAPCLLVVDSVWSTVPQAWYGHQLVLGLSAQASAYLASADPDGVAAVVFGVPAAAPLVGWSFAGQWLCVDSAGPFGFASSAGLRVTVP